MHLFRNRKLTEIKKIELAAFRSRLGETDDVNQARSSAQTSLCEEGTDETRLLGGEESDYSEGRIIAAPLEREETGTGNGPGVAVKGEELRAGEEFRAALKVDQLGVAMEGVELELEGKELPGAVDREEETEGGELKVPVEGVRADVSGTEGHLGQAREQPKAEKEKQRIRFSKGRRCCRYLSCLLSAALLDVKLFFRYYTYMHASE